MTKLKFRSYDSPYSKKNTTMSTKMLDPDLLALGDLLTNRRCDPDSRGIIRAFMMNKKTYTSKLQCLSSYKIQPLELLAEFLHLPTRCKPPFNPSQKNQSRPIKVYKLKEDLVKGLMRAIEAHLPQTCQTCQGDYKVELDGDKPLLTCLLCTRGCHNTCERASLCYNTNLSTSRCDLFICYGCYLDKAEKSKISTTTSPLRDPMMMSHDSKPQPDSYKTPPSTPSITRNRNNVTLEDSLFEDQDPSSAKKSLSPSRPNQCSPCPPSTLQEQPTPMPSLSQIPLPKPMNLKINNDPQRHSPPNLSNLLQDPTAGISSAAMPEFTTTLSKIAAESENSSSPASRDILRPPAPDNCPDYIRGCCPHGISGRNCSLPHRKRCNRFCRNGPQPRYGCTKGTDCPLFHPELCKFSVRNRVCLNLSCMFTHLKFTRRIEYTNSKQSPTAPKRSANHHPPPRPKFPYPPPAPVYQASHISQPKTPSWNPLMDPLNAQPRKIEDEQDFVQRSQFTKFEHIKEEMRQEMKLWQDSILAPMQNKLQELTLLLKQRQPALPALFPHLTTSSAPHPHAMLYNVPPTAWYPKAMNQNPIIPSQCQMSSTPNQVQNNPQLLNNKLPQHQPFPRFSC